jgi:hypothetical protein
MRVVLQPTWVSGGSTTRHAPASPLPGAAPTLAAGLNSHATERPNLRAAGRSTRGAASCAASDQDPAPGVCASSWVTKLTGHNRKRASALNSHGRGSVASSPSANGNRRADRAIGQTLRRLPQARSGERHRWPTEPHMQARTGCKSRQSPRVGLRPRGIDTAQGPVTGQLLLWTAGGGRTIPLAHRLPTTRCRCRVDVRSNTQCQRCRHAHCGCPGNGRPYRNRAAGQTAGASGKGRSLGWGTQNRSWQCHQTPPIPVRIRT